jgi:hypothetical protein
MSQQEAYADLPTLDARWSTVAPLIILSASAVINGGETLKRGAVLVTYDGGATYSKLDPLETFSETKPYSTDDLVVYGGGIYRALDEIEAGEFRGDEWRLDGFYKADGVLLSDEVKDGEIGVVLVIGKVQGDYIAELNDTTKTALYPNVLII